MRSRLLVAAALAAALVLAGCANANLPPETKMVTVPKVTEMTREAAANVLKKVGLKVGTVTLAPYPAKASPFVVTQDPAFGSPVPPGSAVDLIVAQPATSTAATTTP